jgi:hypothetical protein
VRGEEKIGNFFFSPHKNRVKRGFLKNWRVLSHEACNPKRGYNGSQGEVAVASVEVLAARLAALLGIISADHCGQFLTFVLDQLGWLRH